jgi:hypothetical protein
VDDFRFSADSGNRLQADDQVQARTAPVSHQKQPERTTTNAIEIEQNYRKINEAVLYPVAHNGLVVGSSPAGPTSKSMA